MTINDFYYQIIIPMFKDKLGDYLLDRINTKYKVTFNDSCCGSVFFNTNDVLYNFLNFYFLNDSNSRVYFRGSSKFSFIECCVDTLPYTFGISSIPHSCLKDLKFTYLIDTNLNLLQQQKEDFFNFFLNSLGLKEDYSSYVEELKGEVVF